jgi:hypothetical protein
MPIFFIGIPNLSCTLNPSAIYSLWYINRYNNSGGNKLLNNDLQLEHILGPIIGAIMSGLFCNLFFPDDKKAWKRKI